MNDFSIPGTRNEFGFPPSPSNFIRPHKRPLSSMTPIIVTFPKDRHGTSTDTGAGTGAFFAALGASGGSRITSATMQCLWHVLEHNMTMAEAVRRGRVHDQLVPNVLRLENFNFPHLDTIAANMRARGHVVEIFEPGLSAV